jgi:hypothetical protein
MSWCIYKHTNKINGKVYIGQTCQKPESRWQNGKGYKGSPKFWPAIQEFGWGGFEHEILVDNISTQEEANKLEQQFIAKYNSCEDGYNATIGGKGSRNVRPVYQINRKTLEIMAEFSSVMDASRSLGVSYESIYNACCHKSSIFDLSEWLFSFKSEWDKTTNHLGWLLKHTRLIGQDIVRTLRKNEELNKNKKILCLETGKIWENTKAIANYYLVKNDKNIKSAIRNGEAWRSCHWKYID